MADSVVEKVCATCRHWLEQGAGFGTCTHPDCPVYSNEAFESDTCDGHESEDKDDQDDE